MRDLAGLESLDEGVGVLCGLVLKGRSLRWLCGGGVRNGEALRVIGWECYGAWV